MIMGFYLINKVEHSVKIPQHDTAIEWNAIELQAFLSLIITFVLPTCKDQWKKSYWSIPITLTSFYRSFISWNGIPSNKEKICPQEISLWNNQCCWYQLF
jgi:hypothetical protein